MLRALKTLEDMSIEATDGDIGRIKDAYFDDHLWTVRYMVVDTGGWLSGRQVLISPLAVSAVSWDQREIEVNLTRDQVQRSPGIDTDKPVARQHEAEYFDYYGYPYYWSGSLRWGALAFPPPLALEAERRAVVKATQPDTDERDRADPHLRSLREVVGYHIQAIDDSIGHVEDFVYDERDWSLCFLVVDTRNWLPGRHVLVGVERVEKVDWAERKIHVGLTRGAVRESPHWDPAHTLEAERTLLAQHRSERRLPSA